MSPLNQESEEEGKDIDQEEDVVVEEDEVEEDKTEEEKQENESVEEERKKHSKEQENKQVIGSIDNLTVKLRTNNAYLFPWVVSFLPHCWGTHRITFVAALEWAM